MTVFEARNRVGGRVWTNTSLGFPVDLGAAWIHGAESPKHPIAMLAKGLGLKLYRTDWDAFQLFGANGKDLGVAKDELERRYLDTVGKPLEAMERSLEGDISVKVAIQQLLQGIPDRSALEWEALSSIGVANGADLTDLSLFAHDEDEILGTDDALVAQGLGVVVARLARGLDIRTGQRVKAIAYGDKGVVVQTDDGTFKADQVVVTLPLGVLAGGAIRFDPPLPADKTLAFKQLRMGLLDKVVLEFKARFWPEDLETFGYAALPGPPAIREWVDLRKTTGRPVLAGLVFGRDAHAFETMSDRQIAYDALRTLRRLFGPRVPEPVGLLVTRWGQDRFSQGAYSNVPPGSPYSAHEILAQPVSSRLFFAGEATSERFSSTMHGAYWSGEREARRIGELTAAR